ncbi:hypothetical protein [Natronorubrum aibiense]|uniref:Uncharacterized protein n=1 Tax=Natronorubrum aibiense TaxID=348826 RepID=A0A5P9P2E1_9EURY|nr:hypothetical protein [Natronorubrum aibiense]QFU82301.1 hypothetical protein GCU68_07050 [Natronorubrum aibiense]
MSATTTTQETISDAQQANIVLERSGSYYGYLGRDGEGYYHHVDKATNTVYVTESRAERFLPSDAGLYWFRIRGPIKHKEHLEQYDDRDITHWIAYVDSVRGWMDRPLDLLTILGETLSEVDLR